MKTAEKIYLDGSKEYKLVIEYGFRKINNQKPYFVIVADLFYKRNGRWIMEACGMLHDEIRKHFPEYAALCKWHCFYQDTGPSHYISNSLLFINEFQKENNNTFISYFKNHVVLGSSKRYDNVNLNKLFRLNKSQYTKKWLEYRLPDMIKSFHEDMEKFNVSLPNSINEVNDV